MARIVVEAGSDPRRAAALAERLGLAVAGPSEVEEADLLLVAGDRLALAPGGSGGFGPVSVDFAATESSRRQRGPRGGLPLIARAVGLDRGVATVVDATAGLGRDAGALAAAGARVTMVERDPVLAALLEDGLGRARARGLAVAERLELVVADAREYLAGLPPGGAPDAVLIDPMLPARGKTALPGKDLQVLRTLLGHGGDDVELLVATARAVARRRVVVKRPARAKPIGGRVAARYAGSRVRYDVLTPRHGP